MRFFGKKMHWPPTLRNRVQSYAVQDSAQISAVTNAAARTLRRRWRVNRAAGKIAWPTSVQPMMQVPVRDRAGLAAARLAELAAAVRRLATLADVVVWGLAQRPSTMVSQIVVQDEYTHDVILPLRDCWLVFDTT